MNKNLANFSLVEDWPTAFTRFFSDSDSVDSQKPDGFDWIEDLEDKNHRDGFCFAADNLIRDLLFQEQLKKHDPEREFYGVLFAVLYCYRHYLEVTLKHLISIYAPYSVDVLDSEVQDLKKTHNLMKLWNQLKRMMIEVNGENHDRHERAVVESVINDFNRVDPNSQMFRYSHDNSGNRTRDGVPSTDLVKLMKGMRSLRTYFDVQDDVVDALQP